MSKFQRQLANGNVYEIRSLMYLEHDTYEQKQGKFKPYDLIITHKSKTYKIEVKSDRQAGHTGNMAIEYECNGKPSGISSTEADYYIYFIIYADDIQEDGLPREECYKIPIKRLIKIVKSPLACPKVRGGDGNRSCMYLVHKSLVQKYLINKIQNFNIAYNIKPTMSNQEHKTDEVKPMSYSQRLIQAFLDKAEMNDGSFSMDEIKEQIEAFSRQEYEKKKEKTDEMPFGKYRFRKITDVGGFDKQYLTWIVKQECLSGYPGVKESIQKYLKN
jgi:uncharacterized protein (DUF3820 family)